MLHVSTDDQIEKGVGADPEGTAWRKGGATIG